MKLTLQPVVRLGSLGCALILVALFGTACGGGGDGSPHWTAVPRAGGIWEGSITINAGPVALELVGASTDAGELRFVNDRGGIYVANIDVTDDEFSGEARVFAPPGGMFSDGSVVTTGRIEGTIVDRESLSGTFTLDSGDSSTFAVAYEDLYERDSSLLLVAGMWIDLSGTVFTVQADGTIFAQDALNCVYSGTGRIIDGDYDIYDLTMQITQCAEYSGAYDGLGVLDDVAFEGDNNGFVVIVNNDELALVLVLERM
jgi:hypothetical protein